jgi:hypothetical protein
MYFTCIGCAFFSTTDPASGVWKNLGGAGHYPDPMVLVDDDNRWYMYSGCSPASPGDMKTTELDPHDGFKPVGSPTAGVVPDPVTRGFEVPGDFNNLTGNKPYIEGSWVTKRNGTYYWQYAAPGTQYTTYADGIFTSRSPTGPWTYAAGSSPASHKPTGFLGGAGHSSTFEDFAGQSWHISTAAIDVRDATCGHFERRAALHPVLWGDYGEMTVDTYLGDYPRYASGTGSPGWMLLSYGKLVSASSSLPGHPTSLGVNEDIRTWWSASSGNPGEWFQVDLGADSPCDIHAVQTNFADQDANHNGILAASYQYILQVSTDGRTWKPVLTRGGPPPTPALAAPPDPLVSCTLTGTYADSNGQYVLQLVSPTRVHITSEQCVWQPLDASLHGSVLQAKFSNGGVAPLTGKVSQNCERILWSNDVTWSKNVAPTPDASSCAGVGVNFSKLCLHDAKPILRSFGSIDPGDCCGNW